MSPRALVLAALVCALSAPAQARIRDQADAIVDQLNTPAARQKYGVASASRPEDVSNRIDVVFDPGTAPDRRQWALGEIARAFLRALSERTGMMTASVVERSPDGKILDRATVSELGSGVALPAP